jgi:hypothetical protein
MEHRRKEYQKIADAVPGQNQELPESTEITAPKAQLGLSKKFIIRYDYSIMAAANVNNLPKLIFYLLIL